MKWNMPDQNYAGYANINKPVMLIQSNEHGNYGTICVRPVFQEEDNGSKIKFYGDYIHTGEYLLGGFSITCQYNLTGDDPRRPYAFHCGYRDEDFEIHSIEKAVGRVAFLKKIAKAYEKYTASNGAPTTFEDYVVVISKIIGITGFVFDYTSHGDNVTRYEYKDVKNVIRHCYTQKW